MSVVDTFCFSQSFPEWARKLNQNIIAVRFPTSPFFSLSHSLSTFCSNGFETIGCYYCWCCCADDTTRYQILRLPLTLFLLSFLKRDLFIERSKYWHLKRHLQTVNMDVSVCTHARTLARSRLFVGIRIFISGWNLFDGEISRQYIYSIHELMKTSRACNFFLCSFRPRRHWSIIVCWSLLTIGRWKHILRVTQE